MILFIFGTEKLKKNELKKLQSELMFGWCMVEELEFIG